MSSKFNMKPWQIDFNMQKNMMKNINNSKATISFTNYLRTFSLDTLPFCVSIQSFAKKNKLMRLNWTQAPYFPQLTQKKQVWFLLQRPQKMLVFVVNKAMAPCTVIP